MNDREAAANLEVIRTLMERSALYRRALGPAVLFAGLCGSLGGMFGPVFQEASTRGFVLVWTAICALVWIRVFLLVRRQARSDGDPLWSPPARRIVRALLPAFVAGAAFGLAAWFEDDPSRAPELVVTWIVLFGAGLLAASFFLPPGVHRLGIVMLLLGILLLLLLTTLGDNPFRDPVRAAHGFMGLTFGLLQLVFGAWLLAAERRKSAP